ncbi:MAG TPA: bifunctional phosphoribosylaminoimidazolecarboxamide formyltransferase/IMP cyclohydrolase [Planctomycetota bacterium]|nr:bifunctional phosphoribosylaminoimidazolecarboxamide formyltransferase/IMP cyclohydrolase [Planctomycetota bacterium]
MTRRALLSVTDKSGIAEFARGLLQRDFELVSTGGTAAALRAAGLPVTDVSAITGMPEMMDGRVKTLHPAVHGGLLALRDEAGHRAAMSQHGIAPIDVVAVNLYAFRQAAARPGAGEHEVIEQIDIGGPSMIRSASKNHRFVWVVVDPVDYPAVLAGLDADDGEGAAGLEARRRLAAKAFRVTAAYDAGIAAWFNRELGEPLPAHFVLEADQGRTLRYGENPHQRAAFYRRTGCREPGVAGASVLGGKELSYNNLLDADAALELVKEFDDPAAAVIKHGNPCGCATAAEIGAAVAAAWAGDPLSAFGGIVAVNRGIDEALAATLADPERFLELILAPEFSPQAVETLTTRTKWGRNVRLLATGPLGVGRDRDELAVRSIVGGLLVQDRDLGFEGEQREVVSRRPPSAAERRDLELAWRVCKHVKSNAIVLASGGAVVGVGAGQMSRVDSVHLAGRKAGGRARGAVLASDAFFPFRDSIDEAARLGVTAVIQPGGSVKDKDSIAAADEHGLALVLTRTRHFRH